ncbi:hypothetical protein Ddc_15975 [Ditylenchus destructor]|nr:hypothetical protein Ddc_15975 [Ditylenchus destructor]
MTIPAAKFQRSPHNDILADAFRFFSRKTLTEKISPVCFRYFQICNQVPTLHVIEELQVSGKVKCSKPTIQLTVTIDYGYDELSYCTSEMADFPRIAHFIRFPVVKITTSLLPVRTCEFFRQHRASFSHCDLLEICEQYNWNSLFPWSPEPHENPEYPQFTAELYTLLSDVFVECKKIRITNSCHTLEIDEHYPMHVQLLLFAPNAKRIFRKLIPDSKINKLIKTIADYLFNAPNTDLLFFGFPQDTFIYLILEEIATVFKFSTKRSEFCVSLCATYANSLNLREFDLENETSQMRLSLFECKPYIGQYKLWCRKIQRDDMEKQSKMKDTNEMECEDDSEYDENASENEDGF